MGSPTYWQELVPRLPAHAGSVGTAQTKFRSGMEGRNSEIWTINKYYHSWIYNEQTNLIRYIHAGLRQPVPFLDRNQPYSVYILEVILNDGIPVSETNISVRAATA